MRDQLYHGVIRPMQVRIIFVGMFRIALPLNLQVTLLAIQQATESGSGEPRGALFSILVGFAAALPLIVSIVQVESLWRSVRPTCERSPDGQWTYRLGVPHDDYNLPAIR